jgi:hypothetical protein
MMPSIQQFQQQVLASYKAGLATEEKQLKLNKSYLKSPDVDPEQVPFIESLIRGHENQIRIYNELIKQASSPKA